MYTHVSKCKNDIIKGESMGKRNSWWRQAKGAGMNQLNRAVKSRAQLLQECGTRTTIPGKTLDFSEIP
jgi:hypothetical protein